MKYLKLIEEYNNFNLEPIYRNTGEDWLENLLKDGYIEDKFISFSGDEYSGGQDDFGEVNIEFNKEELEKQGLIEVFYEEEFFERNPDICMYVTAYNGKLDYYESKGYDTIEDAEEGEGVNDPELLPWDSILEDYMREDEFIIRDRLKYTDELIEYVKFEEKPEKEIIKLLEENGTYSIDN